MTTQRNPLRWAIGILAMCAIFAFATPFTPVAHADPQGDAAVAIDQAWAGAGGDTSPLGPKVGGVYPAGVGFGQDFVNGAIFFSPETGARSMFGAILDKYRSLGGPADSGLGFPNMDEGPGRAPESRNVTFSAPEGAVIFWTPATGAWLVRGVLNAAWDRVGGSSGPLGVPVEDETYSGETISQRFSGGQLTYDTAAKTFTSTPPELAGQLGDLALPDDAASSIDLAWRVAGGAAGQVGAKQGEPYPVGDGTGQDFAGGKIFFSPDTGAHVVSGAILEKYEAAGGPTGELGFPTANEVDGDVPGSRVGTFGGEGDPAIVWTAEHGAVIVRGPMKAAWDELGGSGGDLGVPIADQTGEDTVTQNFSGGQVTYNTNTNSFSTQPPELAERLAGLNLPQQGTPTSAAAAPPAAQAGEDDTAGSGWQGWYLWVIIPLAVLLLGALAAFLVVRQRRHAAGDGFRPAGTEGRHDVFQEATHGGRDEDDEHGRWESTGSGQTSGPSSTFGDTEPDDTDYLSSQPPWAKREAGPQPWSEPVVPTGGLAAAATGPDLFTHHGAHEAEDFNSDVDEHDPDAVDTAPTPVQSESGALSGRHAAAGSEESRPPWLTDDDAHVPGPNSLFAPVYGAAPPPAAQDDENEALAAADEAGYPEHAAPSDEDSDDLRDGPSSPYSQPDYAEYGEPEELTPDYGQSDQATTTFTASDYAASGQAASDYAASDYAASDYAASDYAASDYAASDFAASDYAASDYEAADYDRPEYSEPEYSQPEYERPDETPLADEQSADAPSSSPTTSSAAPPAIHLPLDDPDEAPEGYPIKGSMRTGTYHSPGSASYDVTVAEIWFATEELAESNGFTRAE